MGYTELLITSLGLSMDAFSAALCRGTALKKRAVIHGAVTALFFGAFQALMPIVGFFLGNRFMPQLEHWNHWIAFGLLFIIGGKMVIESLFGNETGEKDTFCIGQLFFLAIATSIDAMAIGIIFAAQGTEPFLSSAVIGAVTFAVSAGGVCIGHKFGTKLGRKSETAGGCILILIGVKIFLEGIK